MKRKEKKAITGLQHMSTEAIIATADYMIRRRYQAKVSSWFRSLLGFSSVLDDGNQKINN